MKTFKNRENLIKCFLYVPGATEEVNEPIIGATRLIKMMYILGKENEVKKKISDYYKFYISKQGLSSAEILNDIDKLSKEKSVDSSKKIWSEFLLNEKVKLKSPMYKLTNQGVKETKNLNLKLDKDDKKIVKEIKKVKKKYNSMPLHQLIGYIDSMVPEAIPLASP
ncbi:MAG: hypothetical protein AVW06_03120 [Hadesarchaea archaeon DG-33-1]|nr:MAG: hypothetical protein AVW06_03120 [Hadesarchaea archaeon DG-33-1]